MDPVLEILVVLFLGFLVVVFFFFSFGETKFETVFFHINIEEEDFNI